MYRLSLLLALVALSTGQTYPAFTNLMEFYTLNGKTADPCVNKEQLGSIGTVTRKDCLGTEWPEPSVTVTAPTVGSVAPAWVTLYNGVAGQSLSILGRNLVSGSLALSKRGRGCDDIDTDIVRIAATANAAGTQLTFPMTAPGAQATWVADTLEMEDAPRKICWVETANAAANPVNTDAYQYTGFKWALVWDCDTAVAAKACSRLPGNVANAAAAPWSTLTNRERHIRTGRTTCCRHTQMGQVTDGIRAVGQCINPNVETCCQGARVEPSTMRCCNTQFSLVQYYDKPCSCKAPTTANPSCPTGEQCCTMTKYTELASIQTTSVSTWPTFMGECFNPTTHRCCDTGFRYDPGQDQCCNITGIQSLNTPCPCNLDSDCQGGQTTAGQNSSFGVDGGMYCCKQFWPTPTENRDTLISKSDTGVAYPRCNKYNNYLSNSFAWGRYPQATSPYQAQKCLGQCIDNRFQVCCNGVACRKEYEKCCNSTCCNRYTATCVDGARPGTPNNKWNYNELDQIFEVCSTVEVLNPLKAFWIFVLPAYLLLVTCVSCAFVLAFIGKSARRYFSFLERAMIAVAVLTIIFGVACFFAPVYKYGVWLVFASLFTIIAAAARSKWLNFALVIIQFLTLMYLLDPFHGNNFLTFASLRTQAGNADPQSAGLMNAVLKMWNDQTYCTNYYEYFNLDPQLIDFRRSNSQKTTFGYCGHGWITALLVFCVIAITLVIIQLILDLVAFVLRFKEERSYDPLVLEVLGADEVTPQYPY